jgi:hypothetical protein
LGFPIFCADIRAFDTLWRQGARLLTVELLSYGRLKKEVALAVGGFTGSCEQEI